MALNSMCAMACSKAARPALPRRTMSELTKFIFEGLPVRGMLVRLTGAWQEVLQRRKALGRIPPEVRRLLGEMSAAGVLMQASIQFKGALVLQIHGDGPVRLAVAEVQPDLAFRATAKVVGEVPAGADLAGMLNVHGQGRCAITLDPHDRLPGQQPYQGVVPLHGDRREPLQQVQQVLEHYMLQSEQLDTRLVLAANDEVAAGLLIQRLPVQGAGNLAGRRNEDDIGLSEDYKRIALLAATLTRDELLTLDAATDPAPPVLAGDRAPLRPAGAAFCLHLFARAGARHAARPGPRRKRQPDPRTRPGRGGLRLLR
jgi:molecular chaperone Hsp33